MSFTSSYLPAGRMTVVGARSPVDRRRKALERVSKELSRGNYEIALSLVKQLKGKHGCLSAFGSSKLLPKKSTVSDKLESLIDAVCKRIDSVSAESSNSERIFKEEEEETQKTNCSPEQDWFNVVHHESGHFLVGYLLGVLPRHYVIPNLEAIKQNVTGRVEFVGFEFLREVGAANQLMNDDVKGRMNEEGNGGQGNISSKMLNNFSCVILGGMVTEQMIFGYSEGYYSDAVKFKSVLRWRGLSETEKESHIRWAALNTVSLLHTYSEARVLLAEAMAKSKPVGACIEAIESAIS
ncbi:unnamed protein product [Cochlearia groenlandica]